MSRIRVDEISSTEDLAPFALVSDLVAFAEKAPRMVTRVTSLAEMQSLEEPETWDVVVVARREGGVGYGGGLFRFAEDQPKSSHDGGTVVSPTASSLGDISNELFLQGQGESDPEGVGCWLRIWEEKDGLSVDWFGRDEFAVYQAIENDYNAMVVFPFKQAYTLNRVCRSENKDLSVAFNHCKFTQSETNEEGMFALYGGWSSTYGVNSINYNASNGYPYADLDGELNADRGDVVKFISDDPYPWFINCSAGEFREVYYGGINNGTRLEFATPFRAEYYNTNPRVAKLMPYQLELIGPAVFEQSRTYTFESSDADYDPESPILIGSALRPILRNLRCQHSYTTAFKFHSCYNPVIRDSQVVYGADTGDDNDQNGSGWLGYGVQAYNTERLEMHNCDGSLVRHMFVSIGGGREDGNTSNGEFTSHGPSRNCHVYDSTCVDSTSSAWDSHHGQEDTHFYNCVSLRSKSGGFQARGLRTKFYNCTSHEDRQGLYNFVQSNYAPGDEAYTFGTEWHGGEVINPRDRVINQSDNVGKLLIKNLTVTFLEGKTHTPYDLFQLFSTVEFSGLSVRMAGSFTNLSRIWRIESGVPTLDIFHADIVNDSNTDFSGRSLINGLGVVYLDYFHMRSSTWGSIFQEVPNSGSVLGLVNCNVSEPVDGYTNVEILALPSNNWYRGPIQPDRLTSWGRMAHTVQG